MVVLNFGAGDALCRILLYQAFDKVLQIVTFVLPGGLNHLEVSVSYFFKHSGLILTVERWLASD